MDLIKEVSKLPKIISCAFALFLLGLWTPPASASTEKADKGSVPQTAGLMWNRTGLPAVFPLVVKSPKGRDYFLTLINNKTGEEALAAYIQGGSFFKVLVPPGEFRLSFAAGIVWEGEENLFGPGKLTQVFELEMPLTFEVRNPNIKAGHIVDMSMITRDQMVQADTKEQLICQTLRWEYPRLAVGEEIRHGLMGLKDRRLNWRWYGQLLFPVKHPTGTLRHPIRLKHRYVNPIRTVQSRICG